MTKVDVQPGICGFTVLVLVEKGKERKVRIALETECKMVQKMLEDISELDMMAAFTGLLNNPVYKSAARNIRHVGCPVPSAILKALEVEFGICIPKDVHIKFLKDTETAP